MELKENQSVIKTSITDLSRPAQSIKEKMQAKQQKPQGRKSKKEKQPAKYTNWHLPALFNQIELARINAGGPRWSTRAIVHQLHKRDYRTFKGLCHTTLDAWIDGSGGKPKWSERTLERVKEGNTLGHNNKGQQGILVHSCNTRR